MSPSDVPGPGRLGDDRKVYHRTLYWGVLVPEKSVPSRTPGSGITASDVGFLLFTVVLLLGVAFYLYWGFSYNGWLDNGVYAVTITLVGFGLAGMLVTAPHPPGHEVAV